MCWRASGPNLVSHAQLHPRLALLLADLGWTGLTAPQEATLGPVLAGENVLLVAPTGHGKTEAALLPVMGRLLAERDALARRKRPWPKGFKAIYVTPLRALNRDLLGRLESWAEALDLRVGVRHGDTSQSERGRQARNPPDLLITTPETLQLLLYGDTLRRHLATVRFVVLDEVHDLAASERGAQLAVALERLEEVIGQPGELRAAKAAERPCPRQPDARPAGGFQRIGLSATVADPTAVAAFVGGQGPEGPRAVNLLEVAADKRLELAVIQPRVRDDDDATAGTLMVPPSAVAELRTARQLARAHQRVLVFQNTRDSAELMVSRSAVLDTQAGRPHLLELHHGSLSAEVRADVEDRFKSGEVHALVATSSLELGIDVGAIDHVVQVHSPRSVTRLVQRLGRAGHRAGAVSAGTLVASGPEDVLECMAVARSAIEGRLEPLRLRDAPLVVLANQLVALTNEYAELDPDWTYAVVTRAYPFRDLDEGLFQATWDALLEAKTLYASETAARRMARSGRARKHFLSHIGMIVDERTFRIFDEATKRTIGSVDDSFVAASLHPGALFIMAGRPWQVLEIENEEQRVRVGPVAEIGAVPQWSGSDLPVSREVAQEVARLRGHIAAGNADELAAYPVEPSALAAAAEPIRRHQDAGLEVPTGRLVTIEQSRRLVVVNVALGSRGNEALGRITQALLHQRFGAAVGLETDAYRVHLTLPAGEARVDLEELWDSLDPETLDLLLAMILRDNPLTRHHLVQVAKQFGAVPDALDPNRFTKARMQSLLDQLALQEETLSRLVHDRLDVEVVQDFLRDLAAGRVTVVRQGLGPLSLLRQEETRNLFAAPKSDDKLLLEVRRRIEDSDILMACCSCASSWSPGKARDLPRRVACRRCGSIQVACLRPWNEDQIGLLKGDGARLGADDRALRNRFIKNGAMVASFGRVACLAMVARGIGPDGAARLLQKIQDPEDPRFWREILQMELTFARTNAFWKR